MAHACAVSNARTEERGASPGLVGPRSNQERGTEEAQTVMNEVCSSRPAAAGVIAFEEMLARSVACFPRPPSDCELA